MNTPSKLLLAVIAAAALSFARPVSANLITNGGFETGDFTGWTDTGHLSNIGVSGNVSGTAPHSGNFQAFFSPNVGHNFLSQNIATSAAASYTITFFLALVGDPANDFFSVNWNGASIFSLLFVGPFDYTEFTFNVTATSPLSELQFEFRNDAAFRGSYWLLDDVSVTPTGVGVPDAGSTLPLLGFASLGLVALRRKLGC